MFVKPQHFHFVGIGGIGMSGLAEILLNLGFQVSGSDLKSTPITERLAGIGATCYEGHAAAQVGDARALVVTSALDESNPEVAEARRRKIPVIARGELLAELMRSRYGIAIGGSHGKTTTTSMVASILTHAGLDPTVVVGGRVRAMGGSNAHLGQTQFMVVESDESDGSFLRLAPILNVVTNIDREHLDHYGTFDNVRAAFIQFLNKVPFYGASIVCLDDEHVQALLPEVRRRVVTYGTSPQADLVITESRCSHLHSTFRVRRGNEALGEFELNVPGEHNVLNATAALGIALELEVGPAEIRAGLAKFTGVDRRFQTRGIAAGVTVIDDYGHHPTEIRATLAAARGCRCERVHAIFQPHRYTRTSFLMDDFARAFNHADSVRVLDIYAASEAPLPGVTAEELVHRLRAYGHRDARYAGTSEQAAATLLPELREGDLVITLGAGNVWQAADRVLAGLKERSTHGS